jgi:hypothetical protein
LIVLASHLPGEGRFRSEQFRIVSLLCVDDLDYSRGLQSLWGSDHTLIVLEHDMECSDELIQGLLDCPHSLCTHSYLLHWASTHSAKPHYAQMVGSRPSVGGGDWIKRGDEWADFTGIGFCKITPEARVRPLEETGWQDVDCAVTKAVEGRWHVHSPPIEHYHR